MAKDTVVSPRRATADRRTARAHRRAIPLPLAAIIALLPPIIFLWFVVFVSPTSAAGSVTFTVNSTLDEPDASAGDLICKSTPSGVCTLRAAIAQSYATQGGARVWDTATIVVPGGTYTLTKGQLDILGTTTANPVTALTIQGAGPTATIIDGNGQNPNCYPATAFSCRIFDMKNGSTLVASSMTIRNGKAGIGESSHYHGGGIHNHGNLTLRNAIVADNVVTAANWGGGGLTNAGNGTAYLENVTMSGNNSPANGGAIEDLGKLTLITATLNGNTAKTYGGGIYHSGSMTSYTFYATLAANSAAGGAGVYSVASNQPGQPGGIDFFASVFGTNPGGNCAGAITSTGRNIVSDGSCGFVGPGDRGNVDPRLGPLQDNGGGLPTRLLAAGSPALDTHSQATGYCNATDQRGIARPQGAACDSGAVEMRTFTVGLTNSSGGTSTGGGPYLEGSAATLIATPQSGFGFAGWTVNNAAAGRTNPLVLTIDRPFTVIANFAPIPSFADVPVGYWARDQIFAFAQRGITTGCATDAAGVRFYCPERPVTRAEMAAFLIRTLTGTTAAPAGPATPTFADVPTNHPQYGFIEALVARGITTGCGDPNASPRFYCPDDNVTRAEMAAFIIRAKTGNTNAPAGPATATFSDVPVGYPQYGFIEAMFAGGITTGCGDPNARPRTYCPGSNVTRAEMAVFIIRAYP